jgi:hypothetical protein
MTFFFVLLSFCRYDLPLMLGSSLNTGRLSLADLLSSLPCDSVSCLDMTAVPLSSGSSSSPSASSSPCSSSWRWDWFVLFCLQFDLQVHPRRFDHINRRCFHHLLDPRSHRHHRLCCLLRLVGCCHCNPLLQSNQHRERLRLFDS